MKILSLHGGHDSTITLFEDGNILYHMELERVIEFKHFQANMYPHYMMDALYAVLKFYGWSLEDIDVINLGSPVLDGMQCWDRTPFIVPPIISSQTYTEWEGDWPRKNQKYIFVNHHVAHMAYAYYTSPFNMSLLFAYDGMGDNEVNTTHGVGYNGRLIFEGDILFSNPYHLEPNAIGQLYGNLCVVFKFLGNNNIYNDVLAVPGKAMGLSSYGKPVDKWRSKVREKVRKQESTFNDIDVLKTELLQDLELRPDCQISQNLLATIQDECEQYVADTISILVEKTGLRKLCLSGGCALNVLINSNLINKKVIDYLYVPPACSDCGVSLGGAFYYWHNVLGKEFTPKWHTPYVGVYLHNVDRMMEIANDLGLFVMTYPTDVLYKIIASLLRDGKMIGWAQDQAEIGPRALGNRSILCNPAIPDIKDKLNEKVKHREWWRPFAPVCLAEYASEWFEIDHEQPYMLEAPLVKEDKRGLIPGVTHVDNTARLQTVKLEQNEKLYKLLTVFYNKTGIPMLLNTSLNDKGKPIANSVDSILKLLKNTELDLVVIGNSVISKDLSYETVPNLWS